MTTTPAAAVAQAAQSMVDMGRVKAYYLAHLGGIVSIGVLTAIVSIVLCALAVMSATDMKESKAENKFPEKAYSLSVFTAVLSALAAAVSVGVLVAAFVATRKGAMQVLHFTF